MSRRNDRTDTTSPITAITAGCSGRHHLRDRNSDRRRVQQLDAVTRQNGRLALHGFREYGERNRGAAMPAGLERAVVAAVRARLASGTTGRTDRLVLLEIERRAESGEHVTMLIEACVGRGASNEQAGEQLFISAGTVKLHMSNLREAWCREPHASNHRYLPDVCAAPRQHRPAGLSSFCRLRADPFAPYRSRYSPGVRPSTTLNRLMKLEVS